MRKPNVERMKRAMDRDGRHRLVRDRQVRIAVDSAMSEDEIQSAMSAWGKRVEWHFPAAEFTVYLDHGRGEAVVEWNVPDDATAPGAREIMARRYWPSP